MSDQPSGNPSWMRRKVMGIPLIYLAGGFVIILAALAWKMKPAAAPADTTATDTTPVESASDTILSESQSPLPALPLGTVTAPPSSTPGDVGNASITDNDEWLRRGVAFLIEKGNAPGEAQAALATYLDGGDVTFAQGKMRDDAIREFGLPPTPPQIGSTGPAPAKSQGPLPRSHTVMSSSDNDAVELALLYYGRNDPFAVNSITSRNNGVAHYAVGQKIWIQELPKPTTVTTPAKPAPRYHTVAKGDTLQTVARRYYGSSDKWLTVYNANRATIGGGAHPNPLKPGQRLLIPYV